MSRQNIFGPKSFSSTSGTTGVQVDIVEGDVLFVTLSTRIVDSGFRRALVSLLMPYLEDDGEGQINKVIFDLGGADYADSSGMGTVLLLARAAKDAGGRPALLNTHSRVFRLVKIAKLDNILLNFADLDQALEFVRQ